MSEATQPRLSKAALVAFFLGISSPFLFATALPALYVGMQAIRAINRSDGLLRGHRLAIAGLVLGGVVTLATVLGTVALVLQPVQERNYREGCTNNLRLLGTACNRYRDHHDEHFPPGTVLNASLPPERCLSWEAAIVPFLMEGRTAGKRWQKLAEDIAFEEAWDAPANVAQRRNVAPFLCPAFARGLAPDQVGLSAYVGVAGLGDDAARLPLTNPRAGCFGYDRLLKPDDILARLDATMMSLETQQDNGCWMAGGSPTLRGVERKRERYIGGEQPFGGLHREGVNVLWADGSVHIVSEGVAAKVFRDSSRITREQGE